MTDSQNLRPEADRICNLVPSRNTEKDWKIEHALAAGSLAAPLATLPASIDLRAEWWTIGNQESTGSCVGWASTDSLLRYHMVKAGKLSKDKKLSSRCTWMASKETDQFTNRPETFIEEAGTSLKAAVDFLRRYGAVPESMLPFHITTNMYLGDGNVFFSVAAGYRIASYHNLFLDFSNWRNWLATQGPILVGLSVDATWDHASATNGNLDTFQPGTVRGGHAVCLVGYQNDGRFIIRNSWGTTWGDHGFGYATEAYIKAAFYPESYGVIVS
ncbi:MAG: C1 family peptidase [Blastocatellia bacterium]|nr:C1 family peptidase [Blastocatellia bacterium]